MKNKSFLNNFYILDFFQQNVSLKLKTRYRVSSDWGKYLSILIIIFLLYNFFSSDMVQNSNPIVLFQSIETKLRPKIKLDQKNFALAFGLTDLNGLIIPPDPTIFNLDGHFYDFQIKNNIWNDINLPTSFCTKEMFTRFPNEYLTLGLSNATCLNSNEANKLYVKGWWDEEEISYFHISLSKCKNQTNSLIVCQNPETIEEFLKDKFFSFWVEQKNIDMTNYLDPISAKIKNFYQLINVNEYKKMNFFLKKTLIKTDDAPIYSNENILETYQHEGLEKDSAANSDDTFFDVFFYSGASSQIFQRNYQKLFNLLASLGGILGALTTIFSIAIKFIVEWKVNEYILNKLYRLRNDQSNNFNLQKINLISPTKPSDSPTTINTELKKQKLFFTLWEWLLLFFRKKKNRTKKESLYLNYIKKMNKKLDLIEILKKLEEIEKMKMVLFNENQLMLFNSISKKYIFFSGKGKKEINENICKYHKKQDKLSQSQLSKIRTHFSKIELNQANVDPIDKRLMKLIDLNDFQL